jgi:2-amino-4-hydroxy-6-hydroxymethyldihydropteridine diphosphokinase
VSAAPVVPALPAWAVVTDKRRAHIARVTTLLLTWADALELDTRECEAWRDAGAWHDALRDVPPRELPRPAVDPTLPPGAWHGPAVADRLRKEGEGRDDVLEAIRWHTVGDAGWKRTGRALFCADYLEPGRHHAKKERRALAKGFPDDPESVLREVVRMRLDIARRDGKEIHARTLAFWEVVR